MSTAVLEERPTEEVDDGTVVIALAPADIKTTVSFNVDDVLWLGPDVYPVEGHPDGVAFRIEGFCWFLKPKPGRVWVRGVVLLSDGSSLQRKAMPYVDQPLAERVGPLAELAPPGTVAEL